MVYYKEFANYYSFNNSQATIRHNLSLLKMFFSLDNIKNKKINELEKKENKAYKILQLAIRIPLFASYLPHTRLFNGLDIIIYTNIKITI